MAEKYKEKTCNVLHYDDDTKRIIFDFNGYGILDFVDSKKINNNTIVVKYIGDLDKKFKYKL